VLAEQLLDGEAEAIIRKIIQKAKQGDIIALRICIDRILPPRRDRPVNLKIPPLRSADDASKAMAAITTRVAGGDLTPAEAAELARMIETYLRTLETAEIERRLEMLEQQQSIGRTQL
jgi:hypothetical protein